MTLFWTLTRVQLRGLLTSIGARNTRKSKVRSAWLILALFGALAVYISSVYSFALAAMLAPTGNADLVLMLMPALGLIFAVLMGSQAAGMFVFAGRDNDLLLALPISRLTLALAKLAAVGIENLLIMACMLLPAGLAYSMHGVTPGWFWPVLILDAVLLALLATAASVLFGLGISVIRNLRQGTTIVNVAGMVLLLALVGGSAVAQVPLMERLTSNPGSVRAGVRTWLAPLAWVRDGAIDGSPGAIALLGLATVVPFAAVAWLVGRAFVALVSGASARRGTAVRVDLGALRTRSPFAALVRREAKRFFGTSIYFLNTGIGLAFLLVGAGYLLVVRSLPNEWWTVASVIAVTPATLAALAASGMLTTVTTTAPSISLEGQRLWIVKSAPLATSTILGAKLAFNVLLMAVGIVPFAIAAAIATRAGIADALLLVALPLAVGVLVAELGLIYNLVWTNLNAANDTIIVKQSAAVVVTLFSGMALVLLAAVAGLAMARPLGASAAFGLVTGVLALLALGGWTLIRTWGVRRFATLL